MNKLKFIEYVGDLLLIGCGIAFIYIFTSIAITGGYQAVEPSTHILVSEIVMGWAILIVGINRIINDVRGKHG